jgi:hypothetical protein
MKSERKGKGESIIGDGKKAPKLKYSKLPVSAITRDFHAPVQPKTRDPRFMDSAGSLN